MKILLEKFVMMIKDSQLRARLFFVLGALVLFRILAAIPIPGIDSARLEQLFSGSQLLSFLNIFSGGGLSNLSIVMLGVAPYITGSIIMQLLTMLSPKMKAMFHEEGELGRKRFGQYSRLLTIPLAVIQGAGFLILLERQGVIENLGLFNFVTNLLVVVGGAMLLMWIGELISEFGIGNGVSLLIFSGIVASFPTYFGQLVAAFDVSQVPIYIGFVVVALVIIGGVVAVTEAERAIPITYAKRVRGNRMFGGVSTYLPLRMNQAGVIPIIFALSILLFPQMLFNVLSYAQNATINSIGKWFTEVLQNQWIYGAGYFILVFLFTYFYTAVTFDPESISNNLQKNGAFIPGVRPGTSTALFISKILLRITLVGALFLGVIAVLPLIMKGVTGIQALALGGTSLLIIVSVILDLVRKIDAQLSMREY
jgi:preprotein translocase subunit SecY